MKQTIENIRRELKDYITTHNLKSLVIGMSGGLDSTVCAALAEPVVKELNVSLIGVSLPSDTNKNSERIIAHSVGNEFCTEFSELFIDNRVEMFNADAIHDQSPIRNGNIKARVRMILLYDLAALNKGLVLSTDNYTEYMLGFWTLHGDHADYGMIQNMWKTEVYVLAQYLADRYENVTKKNILQASIEAIPTDGLGVSASDCEQFGVATYDEVDKLLKEWLSLKIALSTMVHLDDDDDIFDTIDMLKSSQYINAKTDRSRRIKDIIDNMELLRKNPVVQRHERTHFKRNWPIAIPRDKLGLGGYL